MMSDEARARAWEWAVASGFLNPRQVRECQGVGVRQAERPHVSLTDIRKQIRAAANESSGKRRDYLLVALDSIDEARGMYRKEAA